MNDSPYGGATTCRGSIALGTGCKKCPKCLDEIRQNQSVSSYEEMAKENVTLKSKLEGARFDLECMVACESFGDKAGADAYKSSLMSVLGYQPPTEEQKRISELEEALSRIAHPVWWLNKDAHDSGMKLNGAEAVKLVSSSDFLREIAMKICPEPPKSEDK